MSPIETEETIVAIASPTSPALRGVVRLSGNDVVSILARLRIDAPHGSRARRFAATVEVGDPLGTVPVDVMLWPTDRSYTGQPSAEWHTVGSLPVMQALVDAAIAAGARAARPGEFTMRAFLAGRLDLTQAEAVLGVIEAEQRGSLNHALRQLAGNLSRPLEQMRGTILDLLADVEAGLDFVDEDIEFISDQVLIRRLTEIEQDLQATCQAMRTRGGGGAQSTIALRGEPNAGKSSLINCLVDLQVAIVADEAGTTRDAVTIDLEIDGQQVTMIDTAGMEESESEISRQSQDQARRAAAEANLRIWCVDSSRPDVELACESVRRSAAESGRLNATDLWVATKSDLSSEASCGSDWIVCSAITGAGIDSLRKSIAAALSQHDAEETGSVVGTAARCRQSLERARRAVVAAIELTSHGTGHEFVADELRSVANSLGEVTGSVYTEDILDRVFGRFCIGK
jgi:tRNA modification GTPase